MAEFYLSSTEFSSMRAEAENAMPDAVSIYRRTTATDSAGGWTVTEALVETTLVRLDPASQSIIQVYAEKLQNRPGYVANLPQDADVEAGDKLVIGSVSYEVLGILSGSIEIVRQAVVASV